MKKQTSIYFTILFVFGFIQINFAQDRDAIIASLQQDNKYYTAVSVDTDFESTIEKVKLVLKEQGFGIVSEIDMQAKLKKGTGNDIPKYFILGACSPASAYKALQIEEQIGVMLPCNVVVRETMDGKIEVAAINPEQSMQSIGNPEMEPLAKEISDKLKKALASL
jgi:uncharacterized protein (DUF302 family)